MRETIAIYEFMDKVEATLARDALDDAGFDAWLESDEPSVADGGPRRYRLVVPVEDADEARAALTEPLPEMPGWDYDDEEPRATGFRRPIWTQVVAAIVLIGFLVNYAVMYDFLWPWILLIALVGFIVWRMVGSRRP